MNASTLPDDDALARALHRSRVLEDAPETLIQRSIDLFQGRRRATPPSPAGLRQRLAALLNFDSATVGATALGLRGAPGADAGHPATRQLLFTAEGRDVDLRLQPAGDGLHWRVSGQVLGPDLAGTAELRTQGASTSTSTSTSTSAEVAWNDLAEFQFDGVRPGTCEVVLRTADWELALPSFQVGEPDASREADRTE